MCGFLDPLCELSSLHRSDAARRTALQKRTNGFNIMEKKSSAAFPFLKKVMKKWPAFSVGFHRNRCLGDVLNWSLIVKLLHYDLLWCFLSLHLTGLSWAFRTLPVTSPTFFSQRFVTFSHCLYRKENWGDCSSWNLFKSKVRDCDCEFSITLGALQFVVCSTRLWINYTFQSKRSASLLQSQIFTGLCLSISSRSFLFWTGKRDHDYCNNFTSLPDFAQNISVPSDTTELSLRWSRPQDGSTDHK